MNLSRCSSVDSFVPMFPDSQYSATYNPDRYQSDRYNTTISEGNPRHDLYRESGLNREKYLSTGSLITGPDFGLGENLYERKTDTAQQRQSLLHSEQRANGHLNRIVTSGGGQFSQRSTELDFPLMDSHNLHSKNQREADERKCLSLQHTEYNENVHGIHGRYEDTTQQRVSSALSGHRARSHGSIDRLERSRVSPKHIDLDVQFSDPHSKHNRNGREVDDWKNPSLQNKGHGDSFSGRKTHSAQMRASSLLSRTSSFGSVDRILATSGIAQVTPRSTELTTQYNDSHSKYSESEMTTSDKKSFSLPGEGGNNSTSGMDMKVYKLEQELALLKKEKIAAEDKSKELLIQIRKTELRHAEEMSKARQEIEEKEKEIASLKAQQKESRNEAQTKGNSSQQNQRLLKDIQSKYSKQYIDSLGMKVKTRGAEIKVNEQQKENMSLKEELKRANKENKRLCDQLEDAEKRLQMAAEQKDREIRMLNEKLKVVAAIDERIKESHEPSSSGAEHHLKCSLTTYEKEGMLKGKKRRKSTDPELSHINGTEEDQPEVDYHGENMASLQAKRPKRVTQEVAVNASKDCEKCDGLQEIIEKQEQEIQQLKWNMKKISEENHETVTKLTKDLSLLEVRKQSEIHMEEIQRQFSEKCEELERYKVLLIEKEQRLKDFAEMSTVADKSGRKYKASELWMRVQELQTELREKERAKNKQIEDLTNRLSLEMGKKISSDESSLENICNRIRPTTIAEKYELLCSNEWLGAKQALDIHHGDMSETKKLQLLCKLFQTGIDKSSLVYRTTVEILSYVALNPTARDVVLKDSKWKGCAKNEKLLNTFYSALRLIAEETNIQDIGKAITDDVLADTGSGVLINTDFRKYIQAVARITWYMVIQQPPMTFDQSGIGEGWKGEAKQTVFWTSKNPTTSRVRFYVHPALYHGDLLMVKGRVVLG